MSGYQDDRILRWDHLRHFLARFFVLVGDAAAVSAAYALAYAVRFHYGPFLSAFPATKGVPDPIIYRHAAPVIILVWIFALSWQNAYKRIKMPAIDEAIRIIGSSVLGTILSMSAMFLYRENSYSRVVFALGGTFSFLILFSYRELAKISYVFWIQRNRRPQRVLIIGNGYLSGALEKILEKHGDRAILKKRHLDVKDLQKTIVRSRIHEVLIAIPEVNHREAIDLASFCEERGVSFRLLPDILELRMGEVLIDESLGIPTFQLKPVSLHGYSFLMKRVVDVTVAGAILGVLFIPLSIIALIIKFTSPGPVFYKHERMGYRGRPFQFMKFRTMVQDADHLLEQLKSKSDREGPVFKMKNDPRVTSIGHLLRRYSIDELPQLINVLKGEMSLVGPRPQVLWEARSYNDWARKRLNVLPGITGLWQVSGRAELTYDEMIELDIYYIEHWSPGLDIKIILKTLPAILSGQGAY